MRPKGAVRIALAEAAKRLAAENGGASWRAIASAATWKVDPFSSVGGEREQRGVSPGLARQTIKNMVHAGELQSVGREKPAGSAHWHEIYAPAEGRGSAGADSVRALGQLMTTWSRNGV